MDYLCIPHTIAYLYNVFLTLSDLFWSLFIFALTNVPIFLLFLIVDRFHWLQCYYMLRLWSLQTISHIQTLWCHFDPSNVTITYTLPTTPILTKIALCPQDLVRLHITLIWLRLCSPVFLNLIPHTSTLTHCILPCSTALFWLFFVLAHILSVSLQSHSIFCYLHRTMYTDTLTHQHTLIWSLLSWISPYFPFSHCTLAIGTDYTRTFALLNHCSFQLVIKCWCGCFLTIQHCWMYQHSYHQVQSPPRRGK